jgi:hypothetical protein
MADLYKYRLWCSTDNTWEYMWQEAELTAPTTCPTDTGHTVDTTKTSITEILLDKPKFDTDGDMVVAVAPMPGAEKYFYSPNLCDDTTWWEGSLQHTELALTKNGSVWESGITKWIDLKHGKVFGEDTLLSLNPTLGLKVEVSTDSGSTWIEKTENSWGNNDEDYSADYANGTVTFNSPLGGGDIVRASFRECQSLLFSVIPDAGKRLKVSYVEVQYTKDVEMNSDVSFEIWAYNPADLPNKMLVGLQKYKSLWDFYMESTGPYPVIPAHGGATRGLSNDIITIPFKYLAYRDLKSSLGLEIRVKIGQNTPFTGEKAAVTFYCLSEDE